MVRPERSIDYVKRPSVQRLGFGSVCDLCGFCENIGVGRGLVTELRVGSAKVVVEEVGHMREVCAPAKQVQAIEASCGGFFDEGARFHDDDLGINVEVSRNCAWIS